MVIYHKNIRRICLKLTGEAFMGEQGPLSVDSVQYVVDQVRVLRQSGIQLCIVVGGGNIYRGVNGTAHGITQISSDYIGMLATIMNALALSDVFRASDIPVEVVSALPVDSIVAGYNPQEALLYLEQGKVLIFCAGLGHPYFTTDTASVVRALEIQADVLVKATKVKGIYTDNPVENSAAVKIDVISYADVIANRYNVMDMTAFSLCQERNLPVIVCDFFDPQSFINLISQKITGTLVMSEEEIQRLSLNL